MFSIFIDGDACPVKEETYDVAVRYSVPVTLVANRYIHVPDGARMGVKMVVVDRELDAADDWIAERVGPGDVVITADLPLAGRCLEAGARVLGTNGRQFEEDSISELLATRSLKEHLRGAGMNTGGPPPLSDKSRSRFASKLDELVQKSQQARP